jgi:hypothetical protein
MTKPSRPASKARSLLGVVVAAAGHGAHGVEQHGELPALFLATPGKDHVLLAPSDELCGVADAVRAGGAGRGDGVVDALDAEGRGQAGRDGAAHGARDHHGAHALDALVAQRVGGPDLVQAGGAARAGDQAGARVGDFVRLQPGLLDGLLHGQVGVGGGVAHEAQGAAVDGGFEVQRGPTAELRAQASLGVNGVEADARARGPQAGVHFGQVVAQAGHDAHAGDDDATQHGQKSSVEVKRPTFRSVAL